MRSVCPAADQFTSPSGTKTSTRVPTELLGKTSSRLYWLAIIVLVTTIVLFVARHFLDPHMPVIEQHLPFLLDIGLLILAPLAVIVIHRMGLLSPCRMLEVGIVFEILVAFGLASLEFIRQDAHWGPGMSSVSMWILAYGIFVPNTPVRTLVASMVSACAAPLAYWVSRSIFKIPPWDSAELVVWFAPSVLMAGWTYFLSRDLYQKEIDVIRAREMGTYALEKLLGRGGLGEVWMARHRRLGSAAAVKLIRPEILVQKTGREAHVLRRRFEQEAQATARLQSPHTVTLHDFGVDEDGSFYYAMELLKGLDLEALVERFGPQSPARTTKIMRQICDSLAEAHSYGMIHRDVKPSNIFLARQGLTCDFIKVLDFGLVKNEGASSTRLTADGTTAGTPAYMAPELATGAAYDGRADIYSLGCVAYFLLSGTPVFDEATPLAVALAHVQKTPAPLSQRTELPIPPELEEIIMRCLAKNPADRPRSAVELARALDAVDDSKGWAQADAERWWRMHLPEYFAVGEARQAEAASLSL